MPRLACAERAADVSPSRTLVRAPPLHPAVQGLIGARLTRVLRAPPRPVSSRRQRPSPAALDHVLHSRCRSGPGAPRQTQLRAAPRLGGVESYAFVTLGTNHVQTAPRDGDAPDGSGGRVRCVRTHLSRCACFSISALWAAVGPVIGDRH